MTTAPTTPELCDSLNPTGTQDTKRYRLRATHSQKKEVAQAHLFLRYAPNHQNLATMEP